MFVCTQDLTAKSQGEMNARLKVIMNGIDVGSRPTCGVIYEPRNVTSDVQGWKVVEGSLYRAQFH